MEHRTWQISNGRKAESRFLKREAPQVYIAKLWVLSKALKYSFLKSKK